MKKSSFFILAIAMIVNACSPSPTPMPTARATSTPTLIPSPTATSTPISTKVVEMGVDESSDSETLYGGTLRVNPEQEQKLQDGILKVIWSMNVVMENDLFINGIYANVDVFIEAANAGPVSGVWLVKPVREKDGPRVYGQPDKYDQLDLRSVADVEFPTIPAETLRKLEFTGVGENSYIPYNFEYGGMRWIVEDNGVVLLKLSSHNLTEEYSIPPLIAEQSAEKNAKAATNRINEFLLLSLQQEATGTIFSDNQWVPKFKSEDFFGTSYEKLREVLTDPSMLLEEIRWPKGLNAGEANLLIDLLVQDAFLPAN